MSDIISLDVELKEEGLIDALAKDASIGFGKITSPLVGHQLFAQKLTDTNEFSEMDLRFDGSPANDGTRYSEPQMKGGARGALAEGRYGEIDIAAQLTGRNFDEIRKVAPSNPDLAKAQLIAWYNQNLNYAIIKKEEIQIWQVILNAALNILGTDGKVSTINFNNPAGHRVTVPSGTAAAPTGLYGTTQDPLEPIFAMKTLMNSKGYEVSRLIGDWQLTNGFANNPIIQSRLGTLTITGGGLTNRSGLISLETMQSYISSFGLPRYEEYNGTYRTQLASGFYKEPGSLVMVGTTGRSEQVFTSDETIILENTLGYYGIGLAVGENNPGRVIRSESRNLKPIGIYGQAFQTSSPVLLASEAIGVIRFPLPSAAY